MEMRGQEGWHVKKLEGDLRWLPFDRAKGTSSSEEDMVVEVDGTIESFEEKEQKRSFAVEGWAGKRRVSKVAASSSVVRQGTAGPGCCRVQCRRKEGKGGLVRVRVWV